MKPDVACVGSEFCTTKEGPQNYENCHLCGGTVNSSEREKRQRWKQKEREKRKGRQIVRKKEK